jgi:hypothetical protein
MASKKGNTNDILVKVDQNNLMYIDPNSVVSDGQVLSRESKPEELVMYVNLEADLIPRTTLVTGNEASTLTSIAKGTFNLMRNAEGRDFDSKWTDAYTEYDQKTKKDKDGNKIPTGDFYQFDSTAQSFGIESINVQIQGVNVIPQVNIKFVDVRGKTLFESPENSPYKAFFHLPWPIFYLTIKGYYGKAIRYRLHLVKFNSRFNSTNGNFEIETTFVGSTYAYLNDIPLDGIMEAPYMYPIESIRDGKFNEKTKKYDKVVRKTSRGLTVLKSVYAEYRQKGLLPKTFPDKTLREVIKIAQRLESILEEEIFSKTADPKVLNGIREFDNVLKNFEKALLSWKSRNLSAEFFRKEPNEEIEWNVLLEKSKPATSLAMLTGSTPGTLELLIKTNVQAMDNNQAFGKNRDVKLLKDKTISTRTISGNALLNIKNFYKIDSKIGVDINGMLQTLYTIQKDYIEERNKLEQLIEKKMNDIIKRRDIGIGFEPTIRNVVGLILASADTYIRLLKDTHYKAFQVSEQRKDILNSVSTDSVGESIYPWPEVKKPATGKKQNVLVYPGSFEMSKKLQSYDKKLWPEVDFVENYHAVSTKKVESNDSNENGPDLIDYITNNDSESLQRRDISMLTHLNNAIPYEDKSIASILYEIWERATYITTIDSFSNNTIQELALLEFDNLKNRIAEDFDIIEILKTSVKNPEDLKKYMLGFSAYERYPYYEDQLPTIPYIRESLEADFKVEKYVPKNKSLDNNRYYPNLAQNLINYVGEEYRVNIYPFNSTEYSYSLLSSGFTKNQIHLKGMVRLNTVEDFISSSIEPEMWVWSDPVEYVVDVSGSTSRNTKTGRNLFNNYIFFDTVDYQNAPTTDYRMMINTPYFHKQLYNDYQNRTSKGRYAGSAYLLLNQLNFKDLAHPLKDNLNIGLQAVINTNDEGVLMSSMFREIGATHYVPYHLILKWGALYHRYKKHILEGVDILSGITEPIDTNLFYDLNQNRTYSVPFTGSTSGNTASFNVIRGVNPKDFGFYPYYHSIFHQIVNDYTFYNPFIATGNTMYTEMVNKGVIKPIYKIGGDGAWNWSVMIDNSKYDSKDQRYTLLPGSGHVYSNLTGFSRNEQDNFKTYWSNYDQIYMGNQSPLYSGETFNPPSQYMVKNNSLPSISANNRKIVDLIATFKPEILDVFEDMFIEFASDTLNEEVPQSKYKFKYNTFKKILKEIVSIPKYSTDNIDNAPGMNEFMLNAYWRQKEKLYQITNDILSNDNLVKLSLSNPKEINAHVLGGFAQANVERFSTGIAFDSGQIDTETQNYIKLYLGEDMDNYYEDFFRYNNVELNEENIKRFRFLIYIYAGFRKAGYGISKATFITYLRDNIILKDSDAFSKVGGQANRLALFLKVLIGRFSTLKADNVERRLKIDRGYNDDIIKLELYNFFKSFNDKWIAGNSIGQRNLLEEFLFLDKANVDIGDSVYIDIKKLIEIGEQRNSKKQNLYGTISNLISRTGFDMRAMPAYINFYGTNYNNKSKITPSKTVAKNIFGTFLEVDYQDSSPKIILQYTGPTSKYLEMSEVNKKMMFKDDSFNIQQPNNNPVLIAPEVFNTIDFFKSNKAVAFEVSFGDQNQSIFKGLELNQSSVKNTSESFAVLERLGASETGSSTAQIDIGLFDIYRSQSYTCDVTMMGNVMIQPTMYFYLKNIPLFRGTYWIQEVNHSISNNNIQTTFKGTRIPITSLPDPKDSFMASYRALFDKMVSKAVAKVKDENQKLAKKTNNEKVVQDNKGNTYVYDPGTKTVSGEKIIENASSTPYGISYNGFKNEKYVQLVKFNDEEWLRANVTIMGGKNYPINNDIDMGFVSRYEFMSGNTKTSSVVKWSELSPNSDKDKFYSTKFLFDNTVTPNNILEGSPKTEFFNPDPKVNKKVTLGYSYDYTTRRFIGPVNTGPAAGIPYGIGMSKALMDELGLFEGDVVYFRLIK